MRVVIVVPSILPVPAVHGGAIETLIQNFINENEVHGKVQCDVISVYDKKAETLSKEYTATNFLWIKKHSLSLFFFYGLRVINFIKRKFNPEHVGLTYEGYILQGLLRNSNYDAVIVEGNGEQLHYLKNIISPEKLYFHIHSYHHCILNERNKSLMRIPYKIISVSDFIAQSLHNNLDIPFEKIITVKNCISSSFFQNETLKKEPIISEKEISIVFTGRIVKEKGIIELLDALTLICDLEWKLYIIGSFGSDFGFKNNNHVGSLTTNFELEVRKKISYLGNRVELMGYIENSLIPEFYHQFDIAVVPSICKDAAPLIIGEFMAAGLSLVSSNMGGIPEYLSKEAGIIVPYNESFVEELAKTIRTLIIDNELREKLSNRAKVLAANYKPVRYYNDIIDVIKVLCHKKKKH